MNVVVVGAGGFGREVIDVLEALRADSGGPALTLLGVLDDAPSENNLAHLADRGLDYLGTVDTWLTTAPTASYIIGIAHAEHRRAIDTRLTAAGLSTVTLVHPAATIGSRVKLGAGTIICAGARLTTNILTGRHVHVHVNATIGHDTSLGDYASAYPQSAISGRCTIGDGATVGASATVIQGLTVGDSAFVGAGAVVTTEVIPRSTVMGVPAR